MTISMQKSSTGSRNLILMLFMFIASVLFFAYTIVLDGKRNPDWKNDLYFAEVSEELVASIKPGMSQAEVDAILGELGEYEDLSFFEASGSSVYGEESNIISFYDVLLRGDPTNSGVITSCSLHIYFENNGLNKKEVDFISDRLGYDDCGFLRRR